MIYYSQRDIRWASFKLGTCSVTIGSHGCFVASLAMLDGRTPNIINDLLRDNGGYASGCNMLSDAAARILGLEYNGKTTAPQSTICIAETDHYKASGYTQHFFVWLGNGRINCPIKGENIVNPYRIVSYRLFKPKGEFMKFELFRERPTGRIFFKSFGNYLVYIPHPDLLHQYWGPNPSWIEVDDIHQVGVVVDEVVSEKNALSSGVLSLRSEVEEKQRRISLLEEELTGCLNRPPQIIEVEKIVEKPVEIIKEVDSLSPEDKNVLTGLKTLVAWIKSIFSK